MSFGRMFFGVVRRDFLSRVRHGQDIVNPLLFFVIATSLVPIAVSPEAGRLTQLAPGMIWITALLSTLLALDGLFAEDYADGSLAQLILSPQPLWLLVLGKVFAHWLLTGLPLIVLSPLLALMLALPTSAYMPLMGGLVLGTASFSLLGAVGAALTVALRQGGMLLSLIVMPFYFPVLIFGTSVVQSAVDGVDFFPIMALLGAFFAFSLALGPIAAAASLKVGING